MTEKRTCGICYGEGRTREWNGYEKWSEVCYQCNGKQYVIVLKEKSCAAK